MNMLSKVCKYRVDQQCCPGGNRPETPRRPPLAKSLVIPAIYSVTCQLLVVFLAVFDQFSGRFSKKDNCGIQDFLNSDF